VVGTPEHVEGARRARIADPTDGDQQAQPDQDVVTPVDQGLGQLSGACLVA